MKTAPYAQNQPAAKYHPQSPTALHKSQIPGWALEVLKDHGRRQIEGRDDQEVDYHGHNK